MTRFARLFSCCGIAVLAGLLAVARANDQSPSEPRVFAPGSISSTSPVECFALTPAGDTAFFDQYVGSRFVAIMESHRIHGRWSPARIAPFSGEWFDQAPAVAPDGSFLIFASNRPRIPDGKPLHGGDLWRVDRTGDSWSAPVRLSDVVNFGSHIYAPSIAANNNLYFSSADNPQHLFRVYRATLVNGQYTKPVPLALTPAGAPAGTEELDPAIARDESFIVFSAGVHGSPQPYHLYIAFREGSGWTAPVDFGAGIDAYEPDCSQLGPDGSTLYFTSKYTGPTQWARRSRAQTERDIARDRAWDNGVTHIWMLSLTPWLQGQRRSADRKKQSPRPMAS